MLEVPGPQAGVGLPTAVPGGGPAPPHPWLLSGTLTTLRFVLDEDSYLVPELDGVRIFSRSTHEFLHEVPGEPS